MTNLKNILQIFASLLLLLTAVGCDEELKYNEEDKTPPRITDFSPKSGEIGSVITITGENLGSVDTVRIGGGLALLKSKISSKVIRATLLTTSRSGVISLHSSLGETTSDESFTINYSAPNITSIPSSGVLNTILTIEGDHFDAVLNVYFGTEKGTIINQKENKILVVIPYVEDPNVLLSFGYFNGETEVKTEGIPFFVDKKEPSVISYDNPITTGETFEIRGVNLDQVTKVVIGTKTATIVSVDETKMVVKPSADYTSPTTVSMTLYYHDDKTIVLDNISLLIGTIYYQGNVKLYGPSSENANFYSISLNKYYNPCEVKDETSPLRDNIHLCLTTGASGLQIPTMNSGNLAYTRFKCDGSNLLARGLNIRFKKLKENSPAEKGYIDKVNSKTLTSVSVQNIIDAGIDITYSGMKQVIRHKGETSQENIDYNQSNDEGIYTGGVNIFVIYDLTNTPLKVGFIELVSVDRSKGDDPAGSMTINCYLEK